MRARPARRLVLPFVVAAAAALAGCPPADEPGADAGSPDDAGVDNDAGSGDAGAAPDDAGTRSDGGAGVDAGIADAGTAAPVCGDDLVTGSTITGTEGIVVAADGTLYYSQPQAVGRRDTDGNVDDAFAPLRSAAQTVWGLALAPDQSRVYAASPSTGSIFVIDAASGDVDFEITGLFGGPNGLTVDRDGHLFVADFNDDVVVRLTIGASAAAVTSTTITSAVTAPNGLLVDGDDLLVLSYVDGELIRLTGGRLGAATSTPTIADALGSPDGVARGDDGTLFVTDNSGGRVLRVVLQSGSVVAGVQVATGLPAAANLEFGAGALRCDRLLVASSGSLGVLDVGVAGAAVPWR